MGQICSKSGNSRGSQSFDLYANRAQKPRQRQEGDDEQDAAAVDVPDVPRPREAVQADELAQPLAAAEEHKAGNADAQQLSALQAFEKCGMRPRIPPLVVVNEASVSPNIGRYFYLCGRAVKVVPMVDRPHIVWIDNLLEPAECRLLQCMSQPRLQPTKVFARGDRSKLEVDPTRRLSEQAHLERSDAELVARIEDRISRLLGWPADFFEPLQIQKYGKGGHFVEHQDQYAHRAGENPRIATLIMYLNEPEKGGETVFLEAGKKPLKVKPKLGAGVLFTYPDPESSKTLHKGAEVEQGEKWIITAWPHQRSLRQPHAEIGASLQRSDIPLRPC